MLVLRFYQNACKKRPLLTHSFETGLIMGIGDSVSQSLVEKKNFASLDVFRSMRFAAIGVCIVAPSRVAWYKLLEHHLPGQSVKTVAKKVIIDQGCFAPCIVFVLIMSVSFANGLNSEEVYNKLQDSYKDILFNNWKVWPAVQICNFYLIPRHLRMSFVQVVALLWNIYFSWKTNTQN